MIKACKLVLTGVLLLGLVACGEISPTPTSAPLETPTVIPTFTAVQFTPPTATPTPIVVPPTLTATPVIAPTPTLTPRPLPPTVADTPTRVPLTPSAPPPTSDEIRARYGLPLPDFLPPGFTLSNLSVEETPNPRIVTVLAEYANGNARFFYNVRAVPAPPTVPPPPTNTPFPSPVITGSPTVTPTATPPPTITPTPLPSATPIVAGDVRTEEVTLRGVKARLSYRADFAQATLAWNEGEKSFLINGALSKDDILRVAVGLK